ncbi:MAG: putative ABC transporter permease [Bacillota bacterium]
MLKKFVFYGLLGWIVEIIWTGLGSLLKGEWTLDSHTYLWMFPIYGLAVFLEDIYLEIKDNKWWIRGLIYMSLIFAMEFLTGFLLHSLIGACPWDYSGDTPFSVRGYIRLDYAPVWFAAGLLFEQVYERIVSRMIN